MDGDSSFCNLAPPSISPPSFRRHKLLGHKSYNHSFSYEWIQLNLKAVSNLFFDMLLLEWPWEV